MLQAAAIITIWRGGARGEVMGDDGRRSSKSESKVKGTCGGPW
jgi:hypothetical protein